MGVSHVYPIIDFTQVDYTKIPAGAYLIGFDLSNAGKLCKMDGAGVITVIESLGGGPIIVRDEGNLLTTSVTSMNFVGAGVTATASGSAVTVTVSGNPIYRTTSIATATHSASFAYEYYGVTYSGGICTVTLPLGASPGDNGKIITIADEVGGISWANRGINVLGNGGQLINGETDVLMKIERMSLSFMFRSGSWKTI